MVARGRTIIVAILVVLEDGTDGRLLKLAVA
jgi:hypothetical protein